MRFIVCIFLFPILVFSQTTDNYPGYFSLCNRGNEYLSQNNNAKALQCYDSAFALVHYQFVTHVLNAATAAINGGEQLKATNYLRRAILNGEPINSLNHKDYLSLSNFKAFQQLKDSSILLRARYKKRVNAVYAAKCDSLFYMDQVVFRNVKTLNPIYDIDLYVYAADRTKYDSISFRFLLDLIQKYGFPSEEKIGPKSYEGIKIVIHHSARMPANKAQHEYLKEEVLKGEYKPEDFAWFYDQYLIKENNLPYYYYESGEPAKLSDSEKAEVNARRKQIGLWPLEDDKLVRFH